MPRVLRAVAFASALAACAKFSGVDSPTDAAAPLADGAVVNDSAVPVPEAGLNEDAGPSAFCADKVDLFCDDFEQRDAVQGAWDMLVTDGALLFDDTNPATGARSLRAEGSNGRGGVLKRATTMPVGNELKIAFRMRVATLPPDRARVLVVEREKRLLIVGVQPTGVFISFVNPAPGGEEPRFADLPTSPTQVTGGWRSYLLSVTDVKMALQDADSASASLVIDVLTGPLDVKLGVVSLGPQAPLLALNLDAVTMPR